jgi:hypothetical protein
MSLQLQGIPVIHFVCHAGLNRCVLGSKRDDFEKSPPCAGCIQQSKAVFRDADTVWLRPETDVALIKEINDLSVPDLERFTYKGIPLGYWAVNSLRWFLRRHSLKDDLTTRQFFQTFITSAWNVYRQFIQLIEDKKPQAVVLFNGMFYPEAAARAACIAKGIRVITHEVGLRPFTAFFTTGEATAYPMQIDESFQLTSEMEERLDDYLASRFSGKFSMAGIRFWPEMNELGEDFVHKVSQFKKMVSVFTNVIFDTSQVHANTNFANMFDWLDDVYKTAKDQPDILFVIRAHPDEIRPGKESRESVANWMENSGILNLPNVVFIDAGKFISSYELIQRSHLVMVYNSTIGLEASLLGKPVLAGGKARFTQLATSFFPASLSEYHTTLKQMLEADEIQVPAEFKVNSRRFLYYQLFATSLDFGYFLKEDPFWKGYVIPQTFAIENLLPDYSKTIKVLQDGILNQGSITYPL